MHNPSAWRVMLSSRSPLLLPGETWPLAMLSLAGWLLCWLVPAGFVALVLLALVAAP